MSEPTPTNDWCRGIELGDGNSSGCSCDCPSCKEAYTKLKQAQKELKNYMRWHDEKDRQLEAIKEILNDE